MRDAMKALLFWAAEGIVTGYNIFQSAIHLLLLKINLNKFATKNI